MVHRLLFDTSPARHPVGRRECLHQLCKYAFFTFRERFQLGRGLDVAAAYMEKQIMISYNALSTRLYDVVQSIQQGIAR